ncbi:glycosyltransferase [Bowmanella sp. JS7-9]|uniref:Glycosyltransferase n=1 Tax=Pseudobowmanella zhangzhouensis TaxID=1537679 RepID=A0ABW1XJ96_9ALTE|nr:glycosyltransferase [Bowmanella sp. JS7-9]TBX25868.1 hypothetical protein TK45_04130 [Bowmanella sp. JS7-9]
MSRFRLLLLGNPNSPFVKDYVKNLRDQQPGWRIDCLTHKLPENDTTPFDQVYINHLCLWWLAKIGSRARIGWLLGVIIWTFWRQNRCRYDAVQIHYASIIHDYAMPWYRLASRRILISFWGSDLLREKRTDILTKMIRQADTVSCQTPLMAKAIHSLVPTAAVCLQRFALNTLAAIDILKNQPQQLAALQQSLGLEKNHPMITLGYSASPGQQHVAILQALIARQHEFESCHFVLPMTYGGSAAYIEKIRQLTDQSSLQVLILTDYMSAEQIAALRLVCRIFVHLQPTDALSGSMQEHLYAGNQVITGDWLDYQVLTDEGIELTQIPSVAELPDALLAALKQDMPSPSQVAAQRAAIERLSAPLPVTLAWVNFLQGNVRPYNAQ